MTTREWNRDGAQYVHVSMSRRPATLLTTALVALTLALTAVGPPAYAAKKPRAIATAGSYVGTETPEQPNGFDDIVYNFKVKTSGRKATIRSFTIAMNVVCSGFPLYTEYVVQPMNTMKVNARTGRFSDVVSGSTEDGTDYRVTVSGVLRGKKVTAGKMTYDVGVCQRGTGDDGPETWIARRTGR